MNAAPRPVFAAGTALLAASAVALAPVIVSPPALSTFEQSVAHAVSADPQLMATVDFSATLNALGNSVLLGVAVGLDLPPALQIALANPLGSFLDNAGAVGSAIVNAVTTAFAADPLNALTYLATLPVNLLTGAVSGLINGISALPGLPSLPGLPDLGGLLGGDILGTLAGFITAPILAGIGLLESANTTTAGLITSGIGLASSALTGAISTGAGFVTTAVTTATTFLGGGLVSLGNTIAGLAPDLSGLAGIPVIGPVVAALGDVLGGLADAAGTIVRGLGIGTQQFGTTFGLVAGNVVTAVNTAIGGGATLLSGAVNGVSEAANDVLDGLAAATGELTPVAAVRAPGGAGALRLASPAAAGQPAEKSSETAKDVAGAVTATPGGHRARGAAVKAAASDGKADAPGPRKSRASASAR